MTSKRIPSEAAGHRQTPWLPLAPSPHSASTSLPRLEPTPWLARCIVGGAERAPPAGGGIRGLDTPVRHSPEAGIADWMDPWTALYLESYWFPAP